MHGALKSKSIRDSWRLIALFLFVLTLTPVAVGDNGTTATTNGPGGPVEQEQTPPGADPAQPLADENQLAPESPSEVKPQSDSSQTSADELVPTTDPDLEGFPVTYHEQTAFEVFVAARGQSPEARAKEATKALRSALEAKQPATSEAELVNISVENDVLTIRVRGYLITTLLPTDAEAVGFKDLAQYQEYLQTVLSSFVNDQYLITRIQSGALKFFWSVFLALIGFLILRKVKQLFDQADHLIDEKRGSLKPITVLSETLLSGEALGGFLAFGLGIGRIVAYLVTIITTLIAILSQFDFAWAMIKSFLGNTAEHLFTGLETLLKGIPSFLLAIFLLVILQGALKVLDLFLKGIKSERISWKLLPPARVPVIQVVGTTLLILTLSPLIVGAVFGRFHTPLEFILLGVTGAVCLAVVPTLASYTVGAFTLWRQGIEPGDWIEVGQSQGEVSAVRMSEIRIVPVEGGTVSIPMFSLLFHPVRRLDRIPALQVSLFIYRDRPIDELLETVSSVLPKDSPCEVELRHLTRHTAEISITAPDLQRNYRHQILMSIAEASDRRDLTLSMDPGEDGDRG